MTSIGVASKECFVRRTAIGSALAVLLFLWPAAPAVAKPVALVGGTIISGTGAASIPDGAIVVDGKKIVAVGRRADVKIPADAQTIDATGKFITPGIIDTNVHLVMFGFYAKCEGRFEEVALQSAQVA